MVTLLRDSTAEWNLSQIKSILLECWSEKHMFTVRSTVRIVRMAFLCYYLLSGVSQSPCIQMKHQTQHHEVRHISRIQTSVIYRLCSYKPRRTWGFGDVSRNRWDFLQLFVCQDSRIVSKAIGLRHIRYSPSAEARDWFNWRWVTECAKKMFVNAVRK